MGAVLIVTDTEEKAGDDVIVVVNWDAELNRLVPKP